MANERLEGAVQAPSIAIVGSGPAGCYAAQFLRKRWSDSDITVFDRLALPYGLVRYGVAPDHRGTKAVARQFDRLFERERVRLVQNTEIGTDLTLDELRAAFDVVILATGLWADRSLDIPGSTLPGVVGSGTITRLVNAHPDEDAASVSLGERVIVVGNGNVALDLIRLILTAPAELREHGVSDDVIELFTAGPVTHIDVVGRSDVRSARFDAAMVRELSQLHDVSFSSDDLPAVVVDRGPLAMPDASDPKSMAVANLIAGSLDGATRSVRFHFGWIPQQVLGDTEVRGVQLRPRVTGSERPTAWRELPADSVISAIGFTEVTSAVIQKSDHLHRSNDLSTGFLSSGLYCVGWFRRGPTGTIAANRIDSKMVADTISAAVDDGHLVTGKPGFDALPDRITARYTPPDLLLSTAKGHS
jgi:ferredoxin/flavodoxin---NADP+ reductase